MNVNVRVRQIVMLMSHAIWQATEEPEWCGASDTMTASDLLCEYSMTWSSNAPPEPPVDVPQLEQLETQQQEVSTFQDYVKVPGYSDAYTSTSNSSCAPNRPSGAPPQPRLGKRTSDPPATGGDADVEGISPSSPKSAIAGQNGRKQGRTRRYWTPQVRILPVRLSMPAADRLTCGPLTRSRVLRRSRKKQPFSKHSTDSVRRKWLARPWSLLLAGCLFDSDQVLLK